MAPVDVTGRMSRHELIKLGLQRRVGADNYAGPGEAGAPTTITLTFVITNGASPSATTITADFAST